MPGIGAADDRQHQRVVLARYAAKAAMDAGQLVSDDIVLAIIRERLDRLDLVSVMKTRE